MIGKRILSILIMLASLLVNGLAIWVCIQKNFYALGFLFIFTFFALILLYLFFIANGGKKGQNARIAGFVLLILTLAGSVSHLTIFKENSGIPSVYYEEPVTEISLLSGFMKEFSEENPMSPQQYLMFSLSFYSDLFEGKQLTVSSLAVSNPGMRYLLNRAAYSASPIASIDENTLGRWISQYNPQQLCFEKEGESYSIYLVTGSVWQENSRIYALDCQGNTVFIPEEFIKATHIPTTLVENVEEKEAFEFENVQLNFHDDPVITQMCQSRRADYFPTRFKHFLFLLYLFIVGILFIYPFGAQLGSALSCALAFPIGTALYILTVVTSGLLRIPIVPFTVFLLPVILVIAWQVFAFKKAAARGCGLDAGGLAVCLLIVFIFLYFCFYPRVHMNYDSYQNVYIGKRIAALGQLTPMLTPLTSYSFVGPTVNIGISMMGLDYSFGFQPSFIAVGLIALYLLQVKLLQLIKCKGWLCWLIPLASITLFATMPMYRISSIFILNNASIGIWFGIAASFFIFYFYSGQRVYLTCAFIPFALFAFARIEGQIFAAVVLVCLRKLIEDRQLYKKLVLRIFVMSLTLYLLILSAMWKNYDPVFWSPVKGLAMVLLLGALTAFTYLENRLPEIKFIQAARQNLGWVMLGTLFLAMFALAPFRPDFFTGNLQNMFFYLFTRGYWGVFWIVIFIFALISIRYQNWTLSEFFITFTLGYGLATFVLMMFRIAPLHSGYGDSSCRMMLHIVPAIGFFFSLIMAECLKGKNGEPETAAGAAVDGTGNIHRKKRRNR